MCLIISELIVTHVLKTNMYHRYEISKKASMESLANSITPMVYLYDFKQIERIITSALIYKAIVEVKVYDSNENLIRSAKDKNTFLEITDVEKQVLIRNDKIIGMIEVGFSKKYIDNEISRTKKAIAFGFMGFFIILGLIMYIFMERSIIYPLQKFTNTVKEIDSDHLFTRVDINRKDEIGSLANSFNQMAERLEVYNRDLKSSETRYKGLFEDSPISLWEEDFSGVYTFIKNLKDSGVTDFKTYFNDNPDVLRECAGLVRVVDVNKASVEMLKYSDKNEILKNLQDILKEESYTLFRDEISALAEGKNTFESETINQTKFGEEIYVFFRLTIMPGYEETWSKVLVSIVDITERVKAEEELMQVIKELNSLNMLVRTVSEHISLESVIHTTITKINDVVQSDMVLFFLQENNSLVLKDVVPPDINHCQKEIILGEDKGCICGCAAVYKEPIYSKNIVNDNRRSFNVCVEIGIKSFAALPIQRGDDVLGVIGIASKEERDFSVQSSFLETISHEISIGLQNALLYEQVQKHADELEEKVEERTAELAIARDKAEESDRLKSAFLATMSHELRTPLNSIIGFTGIILQELAGPLNDEQTKQLGMVQTSARHLLDLINDVLDISKIEAGQIEISARPFIFKESVEKVIKTVSPMAEKKGLRLNSFIEPGINEIVSDKRRIEQILINLVNNAIKFTDHGEVNIKCCVMDGYIETGISDTGIGIKPEDMKKLFRSFSQIDTGLTRQHEGTGLGLSICKKLVDLLGGEIWVESEWE